MRKLYFLMLLIPALYALNIHAAGSSVAFRDEGFRGGDEQREDFQRGDRDRFGSNDEFRGDEFHNEDFQRDDRGYHQEDYNRSSDQRGWNDNRGDRL